MWNPFKKRPPQPQEPEKPNYRAPFEELTVVVKGGATGEEVDAWMQSRGVDESELVQWLAGYVGEVKRKSQEGEVLAALQGLSEVARGELGRMAKKLLPYLTGEDREEEVETVTPSSDELVSFNELAQEFLRLLNAGNVKRANSTVDHLLELDSQYYLSWFGHGGIMNILKQPEEAIASYDRALQIKPDFHLAWHQRGVTLNNLGRLEEAITSLDRVLQIQPDYYEAWHDRGNTLNNLGKLEEAIASYDQALQIKPDDHQVWSNRGIAAASFNQHDRQFQQNFLFYFQVSLNQSSQQLFSEGKFSQQSRQNALSAEVAQYIQQTAQKHFCVSHPELNKRGYQGQLNSLQFPLDQDIICQDTHPEGWGFLHHRIGQAHYFQGRQFENIRPYWRKAENSHKTALKTLTATDYPELHLEVLQDLCNVLLSLNKPKEARVLLQDGTDRLNRILKDPNRGDYAKQELARKFTAFNQLTVSLALQSGNLRQALTLAETGKNTCLRWIWNYGDIPELTYDQIRQLLATPTTALIYWHLSPISLSTFLLLPNDPDPILIPPPPQPDDERDPSLLQLLALEAWVKKWNEDYADYGTKKEDDTPETEAQWYADLETQLDKLKTLLNIAAIEKHLQTHAIDHLILIPHRDLHRFPLPTFFEKQTCTTLPSAYLGLSPLSTNWEGGQGRGLIVENPRSTPKIGNTIKKLDGLPFAEVESALIQQLFVPLAIGLTENDGDNPIRQGFKSLSHRSNPLKWIGEERSLGKPELKSPEVGGFRGQIQCLPNTQATKTLVTEALQQSHEIFHFCGHGAYNPQNPALSCLYLNGEDTLTLQDILALDLQAYRLIVLSACETAVTGNQTITDEYVGLVSGFLRSGATHVLSTLWTVESFATTLLTVTFYQNLHSGQPPATALKNAQIWLKNATKTDLKQWLNEAIALLADDEPAQDILREQQELVKMKSDRPYSHPYYWSAFTLSGHEKR